VLLQLILVEGGDAAFGQLWTTKSYCEGAHEVGLDVPAIYVKQGRLTRENKRCNDLNTLVHYQFNGSRTNIN